MEHEADTSPVPAPRAASANRAGLAVSPALLGLLVAAGLLTFLLRAALAWWATQATTPSIPRDIGKALFAVPVVVIYGTGVWLGVRARRAAIAGIEGVDPKRAVPLCAGTFAAAISIPLTIEIVWTSTSLDLTKLVLLPLVICAASLFFCVIGWRQGRSPRTGKRPFGF